MDENILTFLKKCELIKENEDELEGLVILRDSLLSKEKYEEVKIHINELKKIHSSSALTALQSTALKNQRWPLLNLVRQILRANGYIMKPNRQSNGYDEDGRKKYIRYFIIEPEKEELTEEEVKKIANVLL
jgi:hypothetical protein